jgi:ABC-type anion transport system duplicated permease subunit
VRGIFPLIYVIIGAVIADQHHYFTHLQTLSQIVSAVLAIVLWPLIVFAHTNLHVTLR